MGTTGTALFADDTACDVRDEFVEYLRFGADPLEATEAMLRSNAAMLADVDEEPVFWLALASTQWKYGSLDDRVCKEALRVIDTGSDLARWSGAAAVRRRKVLEELRRQLLSPQPARRRPRRRAVPVVPSIEAFSPDGRARASSCELGPHPHPESPRMQIGIEMRVGDSQGGGGVLVARCEYDEISLLWLDNETLQISYPQSAGLSDMPAIHYFHGHTIRIVYLARQDAAPG